MTKTIGLLMFALLTSACTAPRADAASTPDTAPDGTVVRVQGKVDATWNGRTRPLAQGEGVWAEDVVKTAPASAVEIRLKKNGVVWSMRANLSKKVKDSLAWSAPKAATSEVLFGSIPDAAQVSAGRHGNNEAGHTAESASGNSASSSSVASGDVRPEMSAPKAAKDESQIAKLDEGKMGSAEAPRRESAVSPSGGTAGSGASPRGNVMFGAANGDLGAVEEKPAKKEKTAQNMPVSKKTAEAPPAPSVQPASPGAASRPWTLLDPGTLDAKSVELVLAGANTSSCSLSGSAELRFEIGADGHVGDFVIVGANGADTAAASCLEDAIRALTFPAGKPGAVGVRFAK